tara:strand:- start:29194 stop:29640 length:447 start_codon:yes stop_codon:yes gene_type:complete
MGLSQVLQNQLGGQYKARDVAAALQKSVEWVYKNAADLGGVNVGGRWLFYENNIVEALRPTSKGGSDAGKTEEPEDGKNRMVWTGDAARRTQEGKKARYQEESLGVGAFDQAEVERVFIDEDPHGLLALSHDKASVRAHGKRRCQGDV